MSKESREPNAPSDDGKRIDEGFTKSIRPNKEDPPPRPDPPPPPRPADEEKNH
jgi:hypothetical protein